MVFVHCLSKSELLLMIDYLALDQSELYFVFQWVFCKDMLGGNLLVNFSLTAI